MPYTGVLSDEAIKKSCAAFFVENPIVSEKLDPQEDYKKNEFLTGVLSVPGKAKRKRPKRAYDDLATFLSLSGQKTQIQAGVDEYNRQAVAAYESEGSGVATTASMQLPFAGAEEDAQMSESASWSQYMMLATTLGAVGLGNAAMNYLREDRGAVEMDDLPPAGEEMV